LEEREVDLLYYLIAARLCISVCNSAHTKTLKPDSPYITISEQPAWDVLRKWIRINPIAARRVFRAAAGLEVGNQPSLPSKLSRRQAYSGAALSLSYSQPIEMVQSAFQYMYDSEGNTFLDAYNNIMLSGHCHPKVVTAGQRTMAKLNTNTRYIYEEYLGYSEKLLAKFPAHLNKVFFVNSGSAASDLAIRMAMTYTGKKKIMVVEHGYHGNTRTGIDISHYKYSNASGQAKQDYILETPLPKVFNSGFAKESEVARHFGQLALGQIRANQAAIAAFIAEPIVGCGGQVPLAAGYLKEVYKGIREQGGICISDEVQVGFGRLGDFFWGYERHDVVPDMVILGKPMGNGHPIGAVVTTSEIAESFNNGVEFFSSFGGNPVSCAIGSAVLDVIEEERLQQHAKEVGDHLMGLLHELKKEFREIADVRGSGLFLGVEMLDSNGQPHTALAGVIKNKLRESHILVGTDGPFDSVLKIKPPLSFTLSDAEELVRAIRLILRNVVFFE
jgi:4-aminobutyrate aminotransferase-like enzyme